MDTIDRTRLLALAGRAEWPSVSIYLPVDHTGSHTDADRLRLRVLAKQARERLVADGVTTALAGSLVTAALDLATDESAWPGGPHGLVHFSDANGAETIWLDMPMPELAIVADRFYLRPLYSALHDVPPVWALAIDSNATRLFRLDRTGVEEMALPAGTPTSLGEETRFDDGEESLQYHTVPGATPQGINGPGPGAAMFHGHGGAKDADKVARQRFVSDLDTGVVQRIGAESTDLLVLVGVGYLLDDYRASSDYAHLASEQVEGSPARMSPADVQRAVLAVLAPRFSGLLHADVDEYDNLAGTGRTSSDAEEIVASAAAGRVKTLLIDDGEGPWGYFDREDFHVTHLCPATPAYLRDAPAAPEGVDALECGWDLIDLAAAETLRHGGTVRAFRGESSPVKGAVAVFRY